MVVVRRQEEGINILLMINKLISKFTSLKKSDQKEKKPEKEIMAKNENQMFQE